MVARLGRVPPPGRSWTCCSTPSTSSTATRAIPSSRCASWKPRDRRARAGWCCATRTVARSRTTSNASWARSSTYFGERRRRCRPSPRRRRYRCRERDRRRARRRDAGPGHDQRIRRAHRQLQPHDDHPEPDAEDGHRDDPGRSARPPHAGRAPHRRARQHAAQPAGAVRRATRRSRTRPVCTPARSSSAPTRTSTSHPSSSATGRGSSSPSSPAARRW